ncbi:MAG TPA: IclR family transcriptional regulator [Roseateles sp.]|nr:IclR family transcriptional regulator [Roseateles sp.]
METRSSTPPAGRTEAPDGTGPLERAVALLRLLATAGHRGIALTALAAATGLANSTVHRLLAQLIAQRLATQLEGSRRYVIGPLAYELGLAAAAQFDIRGLCRPVLEALAAAAGETVYLVQRSGDEAVCIDLVEGPTAVRVVTLQIGSRRPLGLGAGGLAILAALAEDEAARIVARVSGRIERGWDFPLAVLEQSLQDNRRLGHSLIRNRITPGVTAIGMSFRDSLGHVLGAISIAGVNARMGSRRLEQLRQAMDGARRGIEAALQGRHWVRYVDP